MARPLSLTRAESRFYGMKLVEGRPDGDEVGGFDDVILPHLDAAYNLARWLVRSSTDAEDVAQEACLRALRYFGTFHGVDARAWLLRIVRNTSYRWMQDHRAQQSAAEFDEDIHSGTGERPNPEALALQRDDGRLLEQAMRKLPARFREVLVLRELEGLSYKEISDVAGIPMGTVMSSLSRARERLRDALRDLPGRHAPEAPAAETDAVLV
jgi:RNA polymerase sigma-70 factor (ECF subfamily)